MDENKDKKYIIAWRSLTNEELGGRGFVFFPKEKAQEIADRLNKQYNGEIKHWIVEVKGE